MVGIHTITVLKHPQALSLHSICLSMCVCAYACVYTPPTCSNLRRPGKQKEPCRGLGIWYSQIPDTGFLKHSRSRQRQPPGEPCWGILEQYQSRRCLKEEGSWSGVSLIHTPKRLHPKVQSEKKEKEKIAFTKDCISEAGVYSRARSLSRQFNFGAHTRGKSSIRPQR